jgi:hypothetical protein
MLATCFATLILLGLIIITIGEECRARSYLACSSLHSPANSSPLGIKYSPKYLILKHPQSMFSLNTREQVSHRYKPIDKIRIFVYHLIFIFSDSGREEILNFMIENISQIKSAHNFFVNSMLVHYRRLPPFQRIY